MKFVKFTEKYQPLAQSFDCENFIINNFLRSSDALIQTRASLMFS